MMASDGSGSGQVEVDGVMSRPSDPMLCNTENVCVSAPIAFSVRKSFLKKFLGNGGISGMSGMSVVFIDRISSRFIPLRVRRARLFLFEKQKPTEKPIGGLPL
ncbi:MAG: hypothetical protein VW665_08280 [Candidatus Puniceispirillum sp.]